MINNEAVIYTERKPASKALGKKLKQHLKPSVKKVSWEKHLAPTTLWLSS
jgi:hypothetical protein